MYIKEAHVRTMMKKYLLRIPDDLYRKIEARSRAWNKPISRLIREALINEYHDTLPFPAVEVTHQTLSDKMRAAIVVTENPPTAAPKVGISMQSTPITPELADYIRARQPRRDLSAGRDFRPITKKQSIKEDGTEYDVDYPPPEPVE